MQRLGVTTARMFGGSGGIAPRTAFASTFGQDLNGAAVTSRATFVAAVADLRSPGGHSNASGVRANPVAFSVYDAALSSSDPKDASGNSVDHNVATLWAAGIEPLVVQWAPCNQFNLTSFDATTGVYWGERWELYKQQARDVPTCCHHAPQSQPASFHGRSMRSRAGRGCAPCGGWSSGTRRGWLRISRTIFNPCLLSPIETPQASDSPGNLRSRTSMRRAST